MMLRVPSLAVWCGMGDWWRAKCGSPCVPCATLLRKAIRGVQSEALGGNTFQKRSCAPKPGLCVAMTQARHGGSGQTPAAVPPAPAGHIRRVATS